jgi:hypothetical protein
MALRGLEDRLSRWEQAGLISSAQHRDIGEYERARGSRIGSQLVLYGFLVLGGAVVSIGVVSLIAANWDAIPAAAKLVTALLVLSGLAAGIWRAEERGQAITFDVLAVLYVLGTLAGIGLVSQVFHTGGELHHGLFFWAGLSFLLATRGKRMFLPSLWVASLIAAVWTWLLADEGVWGLLWHHGDDNALALGAFAALGLAGLAALAARVSLLVRFGANFRVWSLVAFAANAVCADITWTAGENIERTGAAPAMALLVPGCSCQCWPRCSRSPGAGAASGSPWRWCVYWRCCRSCTRCSGWATSTTRPPWVPRASWGSPQRSRCTWRPAGTPGGSTP